ncbi:hypothetical protein M514_11376 [Trichuris suis]|uniref:Uncharacterized protein n=1 Tax=Trichuris suis TaxID=68888 RepID=A0A085NDE5_9BILA|nr:hypothetical protein M513_11376 [Trichuris suis]KFD67491.1 hypothetical protein M514_11376 [Trichuris suis]
MRLCLQAFANFSHAAPCFCQFMEQHPVLHFLLAYTDFRIWSVVRSGVSRFIHADYEYEPSLETGRWIGILPFYGNPCKVTQSNLANDHCIQKLHSYKIVM